MDVGIWSALEIPLIVLQLIFSPILVGLILLQSGKGDDLGSALGGMSSAGPSVGGTGGTSKVLVKATVIFATIFMLNSVALAVTFKKISSSSISDVIEEPMLPEGATELPGASMDEAASPEEATPSEEGSPDDTVE